MLKRHKNHFVFSCSIKAVARLADERGGKKKKRKTIVKFTLGEGRIVMDTFRRNWQHTEEDENYGFN